MRTRLAYALMALLLGGADARANFVFNLSGVTFDDGTLATGSFTTNDALTSLLDYNITTVNGAIGGFNYTPATAPTNFSSLPAIIVVEPADLSHILQLTFSGGLKATGAPILIGQFDSFEQGAASVHRQVTAGSVVLASAVPEPSSLLMGSMTAIAGLGLWSRRRVALAAG